MLTNILTSRVLAKELAEEEFEFDMIKSIQSIFIVD